MLVALLGFKTVREIAQHVRRPKTISRGHLLVDPFYIPLLFTLGPQISCLLLLFPLLLLNFLKDIILNKGAHEVQAATHQFLNLLNNIHPSSLIQLGPLNFEDFIERFQLIALDDDLLAHAETKLWIDPTDMLEKKHQLVFYYLDADTLCCWVFPD